MEWIQWPLSFIVWSLAHSTTEIPLFVGVLMCKEKCLTTIACDRFVYSSLTLACHLQRNATPSFETEVYKIHLRKDNLVLTCASSSPGDRIICTKKGFIRCVSGRNGRSNPRSTNDKVKANRLLFFSRRGEISEVDLRKAKIKAQPYRYISLREIHTVLYSRTTNSLYVGQFGENRYIISVYILDSFMKKRLIRVDDVNVMALDEERVWILICKLHSFGFYKIIGQNETRMFKFKKIGVESVAISSKSRKIYAACYMAILTFSYSGKRESVLKVKEGGPLSLDPQGRYLYYATSTLERTYIIRYNTVTKQRIRFLKISVFLNDIIVDSDSLYVKPLKKDIIVYDLLTKKRTVTIHTKKKYRYICLVF